MPTQHAASLLLHSSPCHRPSHRTLPPPHTCTPPRSCVWASGVALGAVACLLLSLQGACVKLLAGRVPVPEIMLFRSSLAWSASLALGAATGVSPLFGKRQNAALLVLRGVFGTAAVAGNYVAVTNLPLGDAISLNMLKPCVVAFSAWLLLGEHLGAAGAAGLLVSIAGVALVARPPFLFGGGGAEWSRARAVGTAASLAASVCAAGVAYCIRRIGKTEAALTVGAAGLRAVAVRADCIYMSIICVLPVALVLSGVDHKQLAKAIFSHAAPPVHPSPPQHTPPRSPWPSTPAPSPSPRRRSPSPGPRPRSRRPGPSLASSSESPRPPLGPRS